MSFTAKEVVWLARMVNDLQVSSPYVPILYCDCTIAIHIAKNHVFHEHTKHIEKKLSFYSRED